MGKKIYIAKCIKTKYVYDGTNEGNLGRFHEGGIYKFQLEDLGYLALSDDTCYLDARYYPSNVFYQCFEVIRTEEKEASNAW